MRVEKPSGLLWQREQFCSKMRSPSSGSRVAEWFMEFAWLPLVTGGEEDVESCVAPAKGDNQPRLITGSATAARQHARILLTVPSTLEIQSDTLVRPAKYFDYSKVVRRTRTVACNL